MWIEPDIKEHQLVRLMKYLGQNPRECPLTLMVLQKRLDEVREWRHQRELKHSYGSNRTVISTPDLSSIA